MAILALPAPLRGAPHQIPATAFLDIERQLDLRLGMAAIDTSTNAMIAYRSRQRFALCSTFKWFLAAHVLALAERHQLKLSSRVQFGKADLLDYAPVVRANLAQGWLTVEQLCAAAVEASDNSAANLLLRLVGGPEATTAFVRHSGDHVTRLDRIEPSLNFHAPGDQRDSTTPAAMVETMRCLLTGPLLAPDSRSRLIRWMRGSTRGLNRLRAGLPASWSAGNKAGTGPNGEVNDVAIAWPPGRPPILMACYVAGGAAYEERREEAHARVARLISAAWS
jgi:beta-lactamase class A